MRKIWILWVGIAILGGHSSGVTANEAPDFMSVNRQAYPPLLIWKHCSPKSAGGCTENSATIEPSRLLDLSNPFYAQNPHWVVDDEETLVNVVTQVVDCYGARSVQTKDEVVCKGAVAQQVIHDIKRAHCNFEYTPIQGMMRALSADFATKTSPGVAPSNSYSLDLRPLHLLGLQSLECTDQGEHGEIDCDGKNESPECVIHVDFEKLGA